MAKQLTTLPLASLGLLAGAIVGQVQAFAEVYLSPEQALKAIFPTETFTRKPLVLSDAEADKIESDSSEKVRDKNLMAWVSPSKNVVYIDQVLGKHEMITYAVGVNANGKVAGIEILEYRESYGSDVKKPAWRQQFVGKDSSATLRVNKDIVNISGATLSSAHIAGGVRRILKTHDLVRPRL
jgi:Na+-translocating ferredoxin:NAD+ oxidoreductase RnfG subunit